MPAQRQVLGHANAASPTSRPSTSTGSTHRARPEKVRPAAALEVHPDLDRSPCGTCTYTRLAHHGRMTRHGGSIRRHGQPTLLERRLDRLVGVEASIPARQHGDHGVLRHRRVCACQSQKSVATPCAAASSASRGGSVGHAAKSVTGTPAGGPATVPPPLDLRGQLQQARIAGGTTDEHHADRQPDASGAAAGSRPAARSRSRRMSTA